MMHKVFKKIPIAKELFFLALCLVTVSLNYPKRSYNTVALVLLAIIWILSFKNELKQRIKTLINSKITLVFISLFAVYCLGLFFSSNLENGLNVIKTKIPILLVPLIFFTSQITLKEKQIEIIKKVFIISTIILCIYSLIAIYFGIGQVTDAYLLSRVKNYFHSELTIKIRNHPTYFSYTIIICSLFLIDLVKKQQIKRVTFILLFLFFSTYILLLSSKTGVILYILVSLYFFQKKIRKKYKLIFILTSIVFLTSLTLYTNLGKRFYEEWETIKLSKNIKDKAIPTSKKNQRLIALDIFLNQPPTNYITGIGTGDVQDFLKKKYRYYLKTIHRNAYKGLNFHNQFLQITTELGVTGLFLLLYAFILSFKVAIKKKSQSHIIFLICTFIFFCIESFFETQRGIMLFIFTNSMFIYLFRE